VSALVLGSIVAWWYARTGLTLAHYDAKAHLVVARRIADSLTPGWVQIGAVWLPLPHLVGVLPVQWDYFYQTGAFGVGLSVVCFAATIYLLTRMLAGLAHSRLGALAGALTFGLNPNVLYLQSTPMTEPLLMALTALAAWLGIEAFRTGDARAVRRAGLALAAASMTRYEAWPFAAALLVLGVLSGLGQGRSVRESIVIACRLAAYPAAAVLAFVVLSRATVGEWFVQSGFFIAENPDLHRPLRALLSVWWGAHELTSYPLAVLGAAGLAMLLVRSLRSRDQGPWLPALALVGVAILPWYAFYSGHPFRIRYMVPLVPAIGLGVGCAVGLAGRLKPLVAVAALAAVAMSPGPLDPAAPMVVEAQWDRTNQAGRRWRPTSGNTGMASPSWPAWVHSRTSCRSFHTTGSGSGTSCTKATATFGSPRWSTLTRTPSGCSSKSRPRGATCSQYARTPAPITWPATRASPRAEAWRFTDDAEKPEARRAHWRLSEARRRDSR
jgi:hypothetical protein